MRDLLLRKGVPREALIIDDRSVDTLQSARAAARILHRTPEIGRVWVCTSAFHAPRCRMLMRLLGFRTGTVRIPLANRWAQRTTVAYWVFRECLATPWDGFLVLVQDRLGKPRLPPA